MTPKLYQVPSALRPGYRRLLGYLLLLALTAFKVEAHHSHANLDMSKTEIHRGTVVKYGWSMPHVYIKVKAPNPRGEIVDYSIELLHPPAMAERGWDRATFKPGDLITWAGPPDRNPKRYYSGLIWAEKADGTRLSMELESEPVQPSTDFTGLWTRHQGVGAQYLPPEDWPYTDLAKELVANFDERQNPQIECHNPGPPKANLLPYPVKISRPDENTIVFDYEARDIPRLIYLDRDHPAGAPSSLGHSLAWFEGDELVIETTNFTADPWGIYTGVDSSAQKHLLERLTLSEDGLVMELRMTVTDPVYLSAPVVIEHKWRKLADRELIQAPCNSESAKLYFEASR